MALLTMVQAINLALKQEMKRDGKVLVLGEDVGVNGGVFRVTEELQKLFGADRVIDTPLAESGLIGAAIGLAVYGFKPVAEIQFDGFMYSALDQLISHASRIRNRSSGRFSCPLVLRAPYGGGVKALEHHSEAPETYFIHTPGLRVVIPSTPYDAKGLLASAIRDPDPVVFLEPKKIYRAIKQEVPEREYTLQIGKANIIQEGADVTVISWGAAVRESLRAAEKVKDKISCEVIDLRSVSPIDTVTIINSVKKTGRVVIVHEAPKTLGLGAEISAKIMEKALLNLEAPVERVTGFDTIIPLGKNEDYYLPSVERIAKGIEKVARF